MLHPPCVYCTLYICCTHLVYCTLNVAPTLCVVHSMLHPPCVYIHSTYVKPTLCIVHSMLHQPFVLYSLCCTHLVHCTLYICCTHLVYCTVHSMLHPPCVLNTLHMLHPPSVLYTLCCTHLVYELLNPGLEHVDHVKSDLHQLVAAHQGARAIPPARLQRAPSCLRRCTKIFNDQQLSLPTKYIHLYYLKKKKNVHQSSRVKPIPVSKANPSQLSQLFSVLLILQS